MTARPPSPANRLPPPKRAGLRRRLLRRVVSCLPRGRARIARLLAGRMKGPFVDIVEPSHLEVPLVVDPEDPFQLEIWLGAYQPHVVSFLLRSVQPGDTVLCAGLHVGYIASLARRLAGASGRVLSAEPDPHARAWALRNLSLAEGTDRWAPMTILEGGLSDEETSLSLFESAVMGHSSFAAEHQPRERIAVTVRQGDAWLAEIGVANIDVMVLDVEGWEVHVLRGLDGTVSSSPRLRALVEVSGWALRSAGTSPGELIRFWRERGFETRWADRHGRRMPFGVWGAPAHPDAAPRDGDLLCTRAG